MKLYPDCDYFNEKQDDHYAPKDGQCDECYRWKTCIHAFMKDRKPIPVNELPKYKNQRVWVQTPGIPEYGREGVVEDVNVDKSILWLVNDFTCHDYGRVWEAYPIERSLPASFQP